MGHLGQLLQILHLGRAQLADALIDLDEFGAELLEATESGHLALGLAELDGIGERLVDGLAAELVRETHLGAVAGMVVAGASAVGLAAAAERGMDGTAPEVAKLGDCEQELRAPCFQVGQGVGHGPSFA